MMGPISVVGIFCLLGALGFVLLLQSHLTKQRKLIVGTILSVVLVLIGGYNYTQSKRTSIITLLEEAFESGQTLDCEGFLVHKNDFNLISQTYTLIGKNGTPTSNIIILLEKCEITIPSKEDAELLNGHTIEEIGRE